MIEAHQQLDRRFAAIRNLLKVAQRPSRGWIKAIREALGMTTGQLAQRMGVKQPRVVELEKAETHGNITLRSLERAAEALGCRLVYVLVPERPLGETIQARANKLAKEQSAAVEHTMRLEDQGVKSKAQREAALHDVAADLLKRPSRLWEDT